MSEPIKSSPEMVVPAIGLVVGILVLSSSISIISTDIYTPSLPDLAIWFDTTPTKVKLTISLNMLAFGIAQLIHGPLSDRFGRRPILLVSLIAVAVLSIACAAAQTIDQLIVARIFLGIAAAAEAVVGLAIVKDLFNEKEQVKAMALLGMVIAIAPAVAPILGGYIHVHLGWQANFFVISGMALLACGVVAKLLPESTVPDKNALKPAVLLGGYAKLTKNSDFLTHCAMLGVALGLVFVFVTGMPFVLIDMLGVRADHFGYYQAGMVLAFFMGSFLASKVADVWAPMRLLKTGVSIVLTGAATVCCVILFGELTPLSLTMSYMIMTFGLGPLFAVVPSRALRSIKGQAGTASAMLSGIEQIMAGLAAVMISLLHDGTARPMAFVTVVLSVLLFVLFLRSRREDLQRLPASPDYS